ncbi:MAG: 6,7-dimethyl-8-ribityllumazine synthase [Pirellulales bacterium]|nr:6,7-dimethyl-8-ribityllumazine synthase [Pirellulales bacterium]
MNIYRGNPSSAKGRFAIVVSRFNESITARLLDGATKTLLEGGVADENIDVVWVPGAFEIPMVASELAFTEEYDAVICLGAVVRGETTHDQYINSAVSNALAQLALDSQTPVLFGILTCNTLEQAVARSGGYESTTGKDAAHAHLGNKGVDCAKAALEMADLMSQLKRSEGRGEEV